jgi:hypothetical protein
MLQLQQQQRGCCLRGAARTDWLTDARSIGPVAGEVAGRREGGLPRRGGQRGGEQKRTREHRNHRLRVYSCIFRRVFFNVRGRNAI